MVRSSTTELDLPAHTPPAHNPAGCTTKTPRKRTKGRTLAHRVLFSSLSQSSVLVPWCPETPKCSLRSLLMPCAGGAGAARLLYSRRAQPQRPPRRSAQNTAHTHKTRYKVLSAGEGGTACCERVPSLRRTCAPPQHPPGRRGSGGGAHRRPPPPRRSPGGKSSALHAMPPSSTHRACRGSACPVSLSPLEDGRAAAGTLAPRAPPR